MKNLYTTVNLKQAVYDIVNLIPYGRATSYGAIARAIGFPNWSRKVGKIMSECNSSENTIPAHRVVNSQGILTAGNAFGSDGEMQKLLESEGITVKNNRICDWKRVFWDPLKEL
ncbi:MAG: MGMT family protein [Dysgonamonadaceae bacterium]|jgi:methylated-DNA-protein-cysteine methyltransferase-like protein|nr:MGMT family protein [Dysgonamonadaceae bacterium]